MKASVATNVTVDLEDLDCPICLGPLQPPVFQCVVGHVLCSTCYDKLSEKDKCQVCSVTTGYNRCFAVERILQSVKVPCSNLGYGCTAKMPYHEMEQHEKKCMRHNKSSADSIVKMGPCGGSGGNAWKMDIRGINRIVKVVVRHGWAVDAMSVMYERDGQVEETKLWGGTGGKRSEINLRKDEYLMSVKGHCGFYNTWFVIRSLAFVSNLRTFGPYGVEQGAPFKLPAVGGKIIGFHGRSYGLLDALGIYVRMG